MHIHQMRLAVHCAGNEDPVPLNRWTPACWPATIGCMPSQWRKVAYLAVGGLTEVSFAAGSLSRISAATWPNLGKL